MEVSNAILNSSGYNEFITGNVVLPSSTTGTIGGAYLYQWPNYTYCWHGSSESKTEKAYQVLRALMKAKIIKVSDLEDFFSAMDEIVKVI